MWLVAFAWIVFVVGGLVGWGYACRRLAGAPAGHWATTAGVGVATVIALGGLLTFARVAYAPVLVALLVAGLGALRAPLRGLTRPVLTSRAAKIEFAVTVAGVAAVTSFSLATLFPPRVFNYHDDLQKYFAHAARLVATGALAGSPLSALGSETLGGLAFLHSLLLIALPIPFIGVVDGLLGLLLLVAVVASAGWRRLSIVPGAVLGPLLAVAVSPQIVNVSAVYLGAALMATAVVLVADDAATEPPSAVPLGLVYAALVALKPTYALFVVLHLPLSVLALPQLGGGLRGAARWGLRVATVTVIGLAPWGAVHLPRWLGPQVTLPPAPRGWDDPLRLFSTAPLFYGTTALHYTALVATVALAGLIATGARRSAHDPAARRRAAGVLAGAVTLIIAYPALVHLAGPLLAGREVGLRYAIPFLLGAGIPPIVLALDLPSPLPRVAPGALVAATTGLCAAFGPMLGARVHLAAQYGTVLAFPWLVRSSGYSGYCAWAVSESARHQVRQLQALVPAGAPLLAWINVPFQLDFRRNAIVDVEGAGLSTPWAAVPRNVRYVLWQYRAYATSTPAYLQQVMRGPGVHERFIAARELAFGQWLDSLTHVAQVQHDDGEFRVLRLPSPAPP